LTAWGENNTEYSTTYPLARCGTLILLSILRCVVSTVGCTVGYTTDLLQAGGQGNYYYNTSLNNIIYCQKCYVSSALILLYNKGNQVVNQPAPQMIF
jgi:hypothetical protein